MRLDPNFAPAYSTLAFMRCNVAANNGQTQLFGESDALIEKALSLSPGLPDTYSARSQCRLFELDLRGSLADAQRAVAGAPGDARFQNALAYALAANGQFESAIATAKIATDLDPLNIWGWVALGQCYTVTHDWVAARQVLKRALQIVPEEETAVFSIGTLDLLEGDAEKALATFATSTSALDRTVGAALAYFSLGRDSESRAALAKLNADHETVSAYSIAQIHAWRGEGDEAMRDLRSAMTRKDPHLATIRMDPIFVGMQIDDRYRGFLKTLDQQH
jgi:tetratricopeptide (TPR) repeat protein